ncbi:MAG TPA: ABC transporter permease [Cyclobacteriaceae bacterium]|nr:ABC transporter permease [Cyclobacteriaceae bacterium]
MKTDIPFLSKKILSIIPAHVREEIEGDLLQRFQRDVERIGASRARRKLNWATMRFLRPGILFRRNPVKQPYPVFMFKNYFVVAFRNLVGHKTNSAINILSLIVGITCAIIMMSVVRYELSFDSFHTNAKRIYRVNRYHVTRDVREQGVAGPLTDVFREEVSAIENITGVQYYNGLQVDVALNGETRKFKETSGGAFVDTEFFNVFDFNGTGFKWLAGNPQKALIEPFSVVLTQSLAKKYFNDTDPIGQSLRIESQIDMKVTGVVSDLPPNSDFPFTLMMSYRSLHEFEPERMKDDWMSVNANHQAFVLLPVNTIPSEVEAQFDKVHELHVDKDFAKTLKYRLQALGDMHKDAQLGNFNRRTVDTTAMWIMAITGLLLLSVGCINYVNIATAQSTLRGREIGVRKVLGGQRRQLVLQFLSETFVLVTIACLVSLLLADVVLMNLSVFTSLTLITHLFADKVVLLSLAALAIAITLAAGFYPAIVVSSYGIINALRGLTSNRVSSNYLRKTLVVVQFAVTQAFLIGSFIVISQLQYSRNMDLGFTKDLVVHVSIPETESHKAGEIRDLVLNNPNVSAVSASSSYPSGDRRNMWFLHVRRKEMPTENEVFSEYQSVDTAYFGLYAIKMAAGRNFLNSDSINSAIINETLSASLGFRTPEEAIGHGLDVDGKDYTVVGVTKNFHNSSVRQQITNMIFVYKPSFFVTTSIRLTDAGSLQESILALERAWAAVFPSMVFEYRFFDENIDNFYKEERKLSALLQAFSGIFLLLACLGLYGLLSFVVNRRMKEVAVRKVFGAGIGHIVGLISKDYVILIIISFVIAAPMSYYLMDKWLQTYTFHIPITWWVLIAPGFMALAIAMITLSGKLLKAASKNPAETLKYE